MGLLASAQSTPPALSGDDIESNPEAKANEAQMILAYQVGAFAVRANAERLITELGDHDFIGDLYGKKTEGKALWVVVVAASTIPFENRQQELLDAGFKSIPLRGSDMAATLTAIPEADSR